MKILSILASAIIGLLPINSPTLGTAIPSSPALVDTYLAENITATQNTMTLVNGKLRTGQDLSGYMCFTLDASTPIVEYVCGTANGASITGMVRGVNLMDPNTYGTGSSHRRFSSVQVTDYPTLQFIVRKMNGVDSMDSPLYYSNSSSTFITSDEQVANKAYVDYVGSTNPADASETVKGVVQLSTAALTSIGSSSDVARLVPQGSLYNATSAASVIPVTNSLGKLSKGFLSFTTPGSPLIPLIQYATTTVTSTIQYGYTGSVASFYTSSTITSSTITVIGSGPSGKGGKVVGSLIPTVGTTYYLRVGSGGEMSWFGTANTVSTSSVLLIGGGGGASGSAWGYPAGNYGGPGPGADGGLPDGSGAASNGAGGTTGPTGGGGGGTQTAGGGGGAPYGSCGGGFGGGTGGAGSLFTAGGGGSGTGGQYGSNGGGSGGQGLYGGGGGGGGWESVTELQAMVRPVQVVVEVAHISHL